MGVQQGADSGQVTPNSALRLKTRGFFFMFQSNSVVLIIKCQLLQNFLSKSSAYSYCFLVMQFISVFFSYVEIERLVVIIIIIIIIIIQFSVLCPVLQCVVIRITIQLLYIFLLVLKTFCCYISVRIILDFSVAMLRPVIISLLRVLLMQFLNLLICLAWYILI